MVSKMILTLLACVAAFPVVREDASFLAKRDTPKMVEHLRGLIGMLDGMDKALTASSGGVLAAIPVQGAAAKLEAGLKQAAADVEQEPSPMTEADANSLLGEVNKLNPLIKTVTTKVTEKKDAFGSLKPVVKTEMERYLVSEKQLATGLISRAPPAMKQAAQEEGDKLQAYFDSALKSLS